MARLVPTAVHRDAREAEIAFVHGEAALRGRDCHDVPTYSSHGLRRTALKSSILRDRGIGPRDQATRKISTPRRQCGQCRHRAGRPADPPRWRQTCRWIGALCCKNGQLRRNRLAAGVLNRPATAVGVALPTRCAHGLALAPGQVVLGGLFIRPIETRKATQSRPDYGAYGSVSCIRLRQKANRE